MRSVFVSLGLALLLSACPPPPIVPTPEGPESGDYPPPGGGVEAFPDGSPQALSSPCGRACAALARIPCSEGLKATCYRGCLSQAEHQRVPTGCWISAKTPPEARACGGLRCLEAP